MTRADVLAGDDAHATPAIACAARDIDAADAAMRHGAAEDLAVEHAGQAQIVDVFGAARDLGAALETPGRTPDLAALHGLGHRGASGAAASALLAARPKPTRSSCFL